MNDQLKENVELAKSSDSFLFDKGVAAWEDWKSLDISNDKLHELVNMKYDEFCSDTSIKDIRDKLFTVVAYCDEHAKDKGIYNQYPDKRFIARAIIYQDDWVRQLLKYKLNKDSVSGGVANAIAYLENPVDNCPIYSNNHREWISQYYLKKKYDTSTFTRDLLNLFGDKVVCKNEKNNTHCMMRLIYDESDKWQKPEIQGLLVHEDVDRWDEKPSDGLVCLWWHAKPAKKFQAEILQNLHDLVSSKDGVAFDFLYLKDNKATYKAEVIDFVESEHYYEKSAEWENRLPQWFSDDVSDYCDKDGNRQAALVFLCKSFEKLKEPIPKERILFYKNMKDDVRKGISAYTKILSKWEFDGMKIKGKMIDKSKQLLQVNKNLILTGAPGTGKTYLAYEIAKAMGATKENERVSMVQFHPSYDYTDFVEGLRPAKSADGKFVGFERVDGVFKKFCSDALKASNQPCVFIIDEINRGEISKIFGELFFSIDPGYRGKEEYAMQTQYQNLVEQNDVFYKGFYVPDNVYIIGTMNDIDRSVESLDFAMRRRFAFKEIKASENIGMLDVLDDAIREDAINRMNGLNGAIEKIDGLSAAYHIGGAYFMKIGDYLTGEYNPWQVLWENHLQGLLYEYMRGFDEVEEKMRKLKQAYDNPDSEPDGASTDE